MKVKCKCGYSWDTTTGLGLVTCPSCGKKTKTRKEKVMKE